MPTAGACLTVTESRARSRAKFHRFLNALEGRALVRRDPPDSTPRLFALDSGDQTSRFTKPRNPEIMDFDNVRLSVHTASPWAFRRGREPEMKNPPVTGLQASGGFHTMNSIAPKRGNVNADRSRAVAQCGYPLADRDILETQRYNLAYLIHVRDGVPIRIARKIACRQLREQWLRTLTPSERAAYFADVEKARTIRSEEDRAAFWAGRKS